MGGRRHEGRRRAAVEARWRRRSRPPVTRPPRDPRPRDVAVERVGAPMLSDCELLEQFPRAFDDDADDAADVDVWDEDLDLWDEDEDDEDDDLPDVVGALQDALRAAVVATVERQDPEAARALVARGDRILLGVVVGAWLAKARRRHPQPDLPARAAAWVAGTLGEAGPAFDDALRALGPTAGEALRAPFLRVPDDVLVARIRLLAAVVAVGGEWGRPVARRRLEPDGRDACDACDDPGSGRHAGPAEVSSDDGRGARGGAAPSGGASTLGWLPPTTSRTPGPVDGTPCPAPQGGPAT